MTSPEQDACDLFDEQEALALFDPKRPTLDVADFAGRLRTLALAHPAVADDLLDLADSLDPCPCESCRLFGGPHVVRDWFTTPDEEMP